MSVTKEILDGYSVELVDDEPCAKEWVVYDGQDENIVGIQAHYNTSESYSPFHGMTHRRTGPVREWDFDFQQWYYLDQEESELMDSIERRHEQPHFKTIRSAFKWAVMVFEEYKAAKALKDEEHALANNLHRRVDVCHCGRLLASHDNYEFRACMMELHEAGIPSHEHDDLVEVVE